ncbi:MAG: Holliday junction resolvase-like protein [Candidatus Ranarchaeia archaeon]
MVLELVIVVLAISLVASILYVMYLKNSIPLRVDELFNRKKKELKESILARSRAVLKGKISEQMAPFFKAFTFEAADARFIGSPIDYIVFPGYSKREPTEVVLIDIKTGNSSLSKVERKIRDLVKAKKVRFETIKI